MFVRYWRGCEALQNSKYFSYGIPVCDDNQNILFCPFKKDILGNRYGNQKSLIPFLTYFVLISTVAGNSFKKTTSILF